MYLSNEMNLELRPSSKTTAIISTPLKANVKPLILAFMWTPFEANPDVGGCPNRTIIHAATPQKLQNERDKDQNVIEQPFDVPNKITLWSVKAAPCNPHYSESRICQQHLGTRKKQDHGHTPNPWGDATLSRQVKAKFVTQLHLKWLPKWTLVCQ